MHGLSTTPIQGAFILNYQAEKLMTKKYELKQAMLQMETLVFENEDLVCCAWANVYDDGRTDWCIVDDRGEVCYASFEGLFAAMERQGSADRWSVPAMNHMNV